MSTTGWPYDAACRDQVELMFGFDVINPSRERTALVTDARALCATCPHTGEDGPCAALWLSLPVDQQPHGMWAGLTGRERLRRLRAGKPRPVTNRDRVEAMIRDGVNTTEAIVEATGLGRDTVNAALLRLRTEGRVVAHRASAGRGRPAVWRCCS